MNDQVPGAGELIYTRVFTAPRELVFRCLTEPEHLTRFWGPAGTSTPLDGITVDPRPGGIFETVMVNDADGSRYTMRARYTEIVAPERIAWTDQDSGMRTTSTLTSLGGGLTEVQIHQTSVPEAMLRPEAQAGFRTSLDRFAAHLGTLSAEGDQA